MRKDKTADLQEAFINLAKSVEADPPPELLAAERSRDATGNFGEVRLRKDFASVIKGRRFSEKDWYNLHAHTDIPF